LLPGAVSGEIRELKQEGTIHNLKRDETKSEAREPKEAKVELEITWF
jgi:hypothetical protein